jgi:hypothetical protein
VVAGVPGLESGLACSAGRFLRGTGKRGSGGMGKSKLGLGDIRPVWPRRLDNGGFAVIGRD